jgi:ATP-binding cassette, subfamily B (MDR/TAP), member 1
LIGTRWENASKAEKMEKIVQAAEFAFAHEFITELPEGYDTRIGERGGLLSGGQKQRVAIARSIVSDPKVLLLDEATSALDPHAEGIVQKALDNVSRNRTTIVIAHKLATIKDADNIVVMSAGRIVEQGTHSGLLAARGPYSRLVQAQHITSKAAKEASETSTTSDDEGDEKGDNLDVARTLTRYPTADRQRLEHLNNRDNYDNYKHLGLIASIWGLLRRCPELKLQFVLIFFTCLASCKF